MRISTRWDLFGRIGGFFVIPLVGAATPLIAYPTISSEFGTGGWQSIAVGQSIGAGAAVLIELGWGLTGPQEAVRNAGAERPRLYILSMQTKALAGVVVLPVVALIVLSFRLPYPLAATLTALFVSCSAFSANWFFIGVGGPVHIFVSDALPKVAATFLSVGLLRHGEPLWIYGTSLLISSAAGVLISAYLVLRLEGRPDRTPRAGEIFAKLRSQVPAVLGRALSAIYIGLPTALLHLVSPNSVAVFAASERVLRLGLLLLQSIPNALQGFVAESVAELSRESVRKWRLVIVSQGILGLVSSLVFFSVAPTAVNFLFDGIVDVPAGLRIAGAVVVFATCCSRGSGLILVGFDKIRTITLSAALAAVAAVTGVVLLGQSYGAVGAMFALASAEVAALCIQWFVLVRTNGLVVR